MKPTSSTRFAPFVTNYNELSNSYYCLLHWHLLELRMCIYPHFLLSRLTISIRLSNAYLIGPNVTTQVLVYDAYTRERSNREEVLNVPCGSNVYKKPNIITQTAGGNTGSLFPRAWPRKADAASPIPEHSVQASRDEALGKRVNN